MSIISTTTGRITRVTKCLGCKVLLTSHKFGQPHKDCQVSLQPPTTTNYQQQTTSAAILSTQPSQTPVSTPITQSEVPSSLDSLRLLKQCLQDKEAALCQQQEKQALVQEISQQRATTDALRASLTNPSYNISSIATTRVQNSPTLPPPHARSPFAPLALLVIYRIHPRTSATTKFFNLPTRNYEHYLSRRRRICLSAPSRIFALIDVVLTSIFTRLSIFFMNYG